MLMCSAYISQIVRPSSIQQHDALVTSLWSCSGQSHAGSIYSDFVSRLSSAVQLGTSSALSCMHLWRTDVIIVY